MSVCRVCGREVNNFGMHCSGKWHKDPGDLEHLYLALQLTPGASAYLKTFEEVDNRLKEKREDVPGLRQEADLFIAPHAIAVDSRSDLYVGKVSWTTGKIDRGPRAVQKFVRRTK